MTFWSHAGNRSGLTHTREAQLRLWSSTVCVGWSVAGWEDDPWNLRHPPSSWRMCRLSRIKWTHFMLSAWWRDATGKPGGMKRCLTLRSPWMTSPSCGVGGGLHVCCTLIPHLLPSLCMPPSQGHEQHTKPQRPCFYWRASIGTFLHNRTLKIHLFPQMFSPPGHLWD